MCTKGATTYDVKGATINIKGMDTKGKTKDTKGANIHTMYIYLTAH